MLQRHASTPTVSLVNNLSVLADAGTKNADGVFPVGLDFEVYTLFFLSGHVVWRLKLPLDALL